MEGRYSAPRGAGNIGPVSNQNNYYDDLQNWHYPPSPYSTDQSPNYLATDGYNGFYGYGGVNTLTFQQGYSFTSHSGIGCVGLSQHDVAGDHYYDEFITQQLSQPLIPGHKYQVEFWALRRPGNQFRTKLALTITNADPVYDARQNALVPVADANKILISSNMQDIKSWAKVSGIVTIPLSETTNQWVSIGYDRSDQEYDTSLPSYSSYPLGIYFAIDDVAIYDLGCEYIPSNIFGNYSYNGQPHALDPDNTNVFYNSTQGIIDVGGGPGQAVTYTFSVSPYHHTIT